MVGTIASIYGCEESLPIRGFRATYRACNELVGGGTTEVLPTLQNTFLEGLRSSVPVQQGIGQFVATRQAISRPIAVIQWNRRSH